MPTGCSAYFNNNDGAKINKKAGSAKLPAIFLVDGIPPGHLLDILIPLGVVALGGILLAEHRHTVHLLVGHRKVAVLHRPGLIGAPDRGIAVLHDGLVEGLFPLLISILGSMGEEEVAGIVEDVVLRCSLFSRFQTQSYDDDRLFTTILQFFDPSLCDKRHDSATVVFYP